MKVRSSERQFPDKHIMTFPKQSCSSDSPRYSRELLQMTHGKAKHTLRLFRTTGQAHGTMKVIRAFMKPLRYLAL